MCLVLPQAQRQPPLASVPGGVDARSALVPDEREEDVVVLLSLVLVDCGHRGGEPEDGVRAARGEHVSDQVLLAVVGGQDADLLRRVPTQPHVLVQGHLTRQGQSHPCQTYHILALLPCPFTS